MASAAARISLTDRSVIRRIRDEVIKEGSRVFGGERSPVSDGSVGGAADPPRESSAAVAESDAK